MKEINSLEYIFNLNMEDIENLDIFHLKRILDDLNALDDRIILAKQWLNVAISRKYKDVKTVLPEQETDEFKSVEIVDNNYSIIKIQKKIVYWDQEKLRKIANNIISAGDDPNIFMNIHYSIPERKYMSWVAAQRSPFKDARAVNYEQPSFLIKLRR